VQASGARLLRSGGVKTATTATVALIGLASSAVLARVLDQDGLGIFALVLAMVQIGTMLADGGSGQATTRFLAAARDDHGRRHALVAGARARLLTTLATVLVGAALMRWLLGALYHGKVGAAAYLWALALIAAKSLFLFAPAVARGHLDWLGEGGLLVLEAVGILLAYASLWLWPAGPDAVVWRLVVAYAALLLALAPTARRWLREAIATVAAAATGVGPVAAGAPEGPVTLRRVLGFGLPLVLNSSFFLLLTWTDRVMLGIMCSPADLAVYYVAANLAGAGRLLFGIPEQVLYSHLAAGYRRGDADLVPLHHRIFRLFAGLGALFVVVAGAVGTFAIPLLYGDTYRASVWPFQLLLVVLLVRVVSIPASLLLIVVHERTAETRDALGFAFVVNILVNLITIPRLGLVGAIVGSLIAFLSATLYLWWSLWRVARLAADPADLLSSLGPALLWLAVVMGQHRHLVPAWAAWGVQAVLAAWLLAASLRQLAQLGRLRAAAPAVEP
jgi:O-antigen/teichoic acid export membrane protein